MGEWMLLKARKTPIPSFKRTSGWIAGTGGGSVLIDRLLVARCLVEPVKRISLDPRMEPYGVVMPEP
jgi:hypothetical protein